MKKQTNYIRYHGLYPAHVPGMHFHIYKNNKSTVGKRLLLLHGIRLGGVETWDSIVCRLEGWDEILAPDLPGSGSINPANKTDHDFDLKSILKSIRDLLDINGWDQFDLVSYSYGGFLSMMMAEEFGKRITKHFIIESALLIDEVENLKKHAAGIRDIAISVSTDLEKANMQFSELVNTGANQKIRRFSLLENIRPIHNALGFANLLFILADAYCQLDVWSVIQLQHSVTALLTEHISSEQKIILNCIEKKHHWNFVTIKNSNHSIVFSDPSAVAETLNAWNINN